jgi:hypothetical protein
LSSSISRKSSDANEIARIHALTFLTARHF